MRTQCDVTYREYEKCIHMNTEKKHEINYQSNPNEIESFSSVNRTNQLLDILLFLRASFF